MFCVVLSLVNEHVVQTIFIIAKYFNYIGMYQRNLIENTIAAALYYKSYYFAHKSIALKEN